MATSVDISIEPSYLSDGSYTGQNDRQWVDDIMRDGILAGTDFVVTAGTTNTLSISAGQAYVQGQNVTAQGMYRVREPNTNNNAITITNGDVSKPRIDQLVLMVKDASHDTSGLRKGLLKIIDGVATTGATLNNRTGAADLTTLADNTKSVLLLTDILVPAGATTSAACTIRDRRRLAWPKNTPYVINTNLGGAGTTGNNLEQDLIPYQTIPGYLLRGADLVTPAIHRVISITASGTVFNNTGGSVTTTFRLYIYRGTNAGTAVVYYQDVTVALTSTGATDNKMMKFVLDFTITNANKWWDGEIKIGNQGATVGSGDIGAAPALNNLIGSPLQLLPGPLVTDINLDFSWKITTQHSTNNANHTEAIYTVKTLIT